MPTAIDSQWTLDTLHKYHSDLRDADQRFHDERDRRYTEVGLEREKALRIKETADAEALRLAREAQALKDQQTEALRDESLSKSGIYATNDGVQRALRELEDTFFRALKPLTDFVAGQQGAAKASSMTSGKMFAFAAIGASLFSGLLTALFMTLLGR